MAPRVQSAPASSRNGYTHQRRDSDTLRSGLPPPNLVIQQSTRENGDPLSARGSPPGRNSIATSQQSSRHRRSPTAPEHPTSSATLAPNTGRDGLAGKTWAHGENEGFDRDRERLIEDFGELAPKPISGLQAQQQQQLTAPVPDPRTRNLVVSPP